METTALLIIDVQTALVNQHPYQEQTFINNLKKLIAHFRNQNKEIIYIRHDGGTGDELERNTDGWQIHPEIQPQPSEKIFDKHFNSAFRQTGLLTYLNRRGINHLVLAGMQSEFCIDTTCKCAFEYGFRLTIPENCTTSFANGCMTDQQLCEFYEQKIWKGRFAQIPTLEELFTENC